MKLTVAGMAALLLGACTTTADFDRYKESIATFKTATDQTSTAVSAHVLTIREVDRDRMFQQLADTPNPCDLHWVQKRKIPGEVYQPTDCAFLAIEIAREGRFSREGILVRQQVFEVINRYTTLLAAVAESDAPARWEAAAKGLGASVNGLLTNIDGFVSEGEDDTSEEMTSRLGVLAGLAGEDGPLTQLLNLAGQDWINSRRIEALDSVIEDGKPAIEEISRLLHEDFQFVRRRETIEADDALSVSVFAYATATGNAVANPRNDSDRRRALAEVESAVATNEARLKEVKSIGSAMDAFDDAHNALADYAASPKGPQDLADLIAVVRRYESAALEVYNAYKAAQNDTTEQT